MVCVECRLPMVHRKRSVEDRGARCHQGRGLCTACHKRASRAGTLRFYPPLEDRLDYTPPGPQNLDYDRRALAAWLGRRRERITRYHLAA